MTLSRKTWILITLVGLSCIWVGEFLSPLYLQPSAPNLACAMNNLGCRIKWWSFGDFFSSIYIIKKKKFFFLQNAFYYSLNIWEVDNPNLSIQTLSITLCFNFKVSCFPRIETSPWWFFCQLEYCYWILFMYILSVFFLFGCLSFFLFCFDLFGVFKNNFYFCFFFNSFFFCHKAISHLSKSRIAVFCCVRIFDRKISIHIWNHN